MKKEVCVPLSDGMRNMDLRLTLQLTEEQQKVIDEFVFSDGKCSFCREEISKEDYKALFGQPFNSFHAQAGTMAIAKSCLKCFKVLNKSFLNCFNSAKSEAAQ